MTAHKVSAHGFLLFSPWKKRREEGLGAESCFFFFGLWGGGR